jgi:hypothetical protein
LKQSNRSCERKLLVIVRKSVQDSVIFSNRMK